MTPYKEELAVILRIEIDMKVEIGLDLSSRERRINKRSEAKKRIVKNWLNMGKPAVGWMEDFVDTEDSFEFI